MNRRQQHLIVVASGLAIGVVTEAATRLVRQPDSGAWFNWNPDTGVTMSEHGLRAHALRVAGVRLFGVGAWGCMGWSVYRN